MKTRKVMALAGAGVLAVSMMTGCGSSSSTASTTAATTTAAAAETTKETATAAGYVLSAQNIPFTVSEQA